MSVSHSGITQSLDQGDVRLEVFDLTFDIL